MDVCHGIVIENGRAAKRIGKKPAGKDSLPVRGKEFISGSRTFPFRCANCPRDAFSFRWAIIRKAWRPGLSMAIRTPPVRGKSPPSRSGCGRWPGLKSLRQIMAINQSPVGRVCLDNRDSVRGADLQHGKIRAMAGVGQNGCCCLFASPCHYLWLWEIFRHGSAWGGICGQESFVFTAMRSKGFGSGHLRENRF